MSTRLCSLHEYLSLGSSKRELVHITKKVIFKIGCHRPDLTFIFVCQVASSELFSQISLEEVDRLARQPHSVVIR